MFDFIHERDGKDKVALRQKRRMQILVSQVTEEDVLNYLLQHAVDKCFQLIQAMDMTSIAFPAIGAGSARIPIRKVIEQMSIAIARNLANTNKSLSVELYLYDIYNLYSESDYITLFESLAAKAALVEYKQGLITKDEAPMPIQMGNIQLPEKENMNHEVFINYSRKDKDIAEFVSNVLKL